MHSTIYIKRASNLPMGAINTNLETQANRLANEALSKYQAGRPISKKLSQKDQERYVKFANTFCTSLLGGMEKHIKAIENELRNAEIELNNVRQKYLQAVLTLRAQEQQLSKAEKEARNRTLIGDLVRGTVRVVKKACKAAVDSSIMMLSDLMTGDLEFSWKAIKERLITNATDITIGVVMEATNMVLESAIASATRNGGGVALDFLTNVMDGINSVINVVCSGPVRNVMNGVKEAAYATMATPGAATAEFLAKQGQKLGKATNQSSKQSNQNTSTITTISSIDFQTIKTNSGKIGGKIKDVTQDTINNLKKEFLDENTAQDLATTVGKESLAVAGKSFPPVAVVGAGVAAVSEIYGAVCDSANKMEGLAVMNSINTDLKVRIGREKNNQAAVDAKTKQLLQDIDKSQQVIEQGNEDSLAKINQIQGLEIKEAQYVFMATWFVKSTQQIKSISKSYPYMTRDELLTLYFSKIGSDVIDALMNYTSSDMLEIFMRGFAVYIKVDLKFKQQSCPLISNELADHLKRAYNLSRADFCRNMSQLEAETFIKDYEATKAQRAVSVSTSTTAEDFFRQNRGKFQDAFTKAQQDFSRKYFGVEGKNAFVSSAIKGSTTSNLDPSIQATLTRIKETQSNTINMQKAKLPELLSKEQINIQNQQMQSLNEQQASTPNIPLNEQQTSTPDVPLKDDSENKTKNIAITLLVVAGLVGATVYVMKKKKQKK